MTSEKMRTRTRIIGPWPLRPLLLGIMVALFVSGLRNGARISDGDALGWVWLTEGTAAGVGIGIVSALTLQVGVLWQRRFGVRMGSYVTFVLIGSAVAVALRVAIGDVGADLVTNPLSLGIGVVRIAVVFFVVCTIAGRANQRLAEQVTQKQTALDLVLTQEEILLRGDEFTRRQISGTLHDRVQARLIAACLELQMIDVHEAERTQGTVDSVVAQLEEIRAVDVRRVARALSPRLEEVDLESALDELAAQYRPGMETDISVDAAIDAKHTRPSANIRLGAYRIIEQALLNAAGHGAARQCEVTVTLRNGGIDVKVGDDGRGFSDTLPRSGFGSTLMTSWSRSLGGSWSWRPGKTGGVVLEAHLPISGQAR